MSYHKYILSALLAMAVSVCAATPFKTSLLERMARTAGIVIPDSLSANADLDSVAVVRGKEVHLCTNSLGQVSHIGYRLFNKDLMAFYKNHPVFHFVERYLLELDLGLDQRGTVLRMHVDQVKLVTGTLNQLRKVTPQMDLSFSVEEIVRKIYRLTWAYDGEKVVMTIPAHAQLILGANAIELEDIFYRQLPKMFALTGDEVIQDWSSENVIRAGDYLIVSGGIYMSNQVRGDIYLADQAGKRRLFCSPESPSRSISNIMLTGIFNRDLPLKLALNRYGNKVDSLSVTLQQYIAYCKNECCKLYFGIKRCTDTTLEGTLFAYQEDLAYTHMLSVDIPLAILRDEEAVINATAYVYIPLGHIADQYFKQEFNPDLYDKN